MMGVGKSTVGRLLAARLGAVYIDNDEVVERRTGRSVRDILEGDGEETLRAAERAALAEALAVPAPTVVAVAGGMVLSDVDRAVVAAGGTVVWLRATPPTLAARVEGTDRPWIGDDPRAALTALARERDPLYAEVADVIVDVDDIDPATAAARVAADLGAAAQPGADTMVTRNQPGGV